MVRLFDDDMMIEKAQEAAHIQAQVRAPGDWD